MKKILSFILAAVLVVGILPVAALFTSAEAGPLAVYDTVVVSEKEGKDTVTVIGSITDASVVQSAKNIGIVLNFKQNGEQVKSLEATVKNVYKTLTGFASTDEATALSQNVPYVQAEYLFGLTVSGVPAGAYTVEVTFNAVSTGEEIPAATAERSFGVLTAQEKIVTEAYKLGTTDTMADQTLTGKIISVDTAYSSQFGNVTVTIVVGSLTDKPIQCYRMKNGETITAGEGVEVIKVGDTITVTGTLKNYKGTIEFDAACLLDSVDEVYVPTAQDKVAEEAELLTMVESAAMGQTETLQQVGKKYADVTVSWTSSDSAVAAIADGVVTFGNVTQDTQVTLTATLSCGEVSETKTFDVTVIGHELTEEEKQILAIEEAYTLNPGQSQSESTTLTGVITTINSKYSAQYGNITVTIVVGGRDDIPVQCYRMKNGSGVAAGTGVEILKVGDTITVTGTLKNYNGTIEFDANCTLDEAPEMSDEEKLAAEKEALTIEGKDGETLPVVGTVFPEIAIEWESGDTDLVSIVDGKLVFDNSTLTQDATVQLTATLTVNVSEETKNFTVTVKAPSTGNEDVTDVLNNSNTYGGTATNYKAWTATGDSGAAYAGQSAGGNGTIQLRTTNNNSGIVVTTSAGKVVSVTITFHSSTNSARIVNVYGKNTAYASPSDLYSDATAGTLLGTITAANPQTLTVSGDYEYIGLRSSSGALYISEIEITWGNGSSQEDPQPTVSDSEKAQAELNALTFDATVASGAEVTVATAGETYSEVEFEWEVSDDMGIYENGTLLFEDVTEDTEVTVTVYAICGNEMEEKTFTVTIQAPASQEETGTVASLTMSDLGYANAADVTDVTVDSDVTITFAKATGSSAPKYYTSGAAVRAYANNTITFSSEKTITKIVMNYVSGYTGSMTLTGYSCSGTVGTWEGSASTVTFTVSSGQARVVSVEVTYE